MRSDHLSKHIKTHAKPGGGPLPDNLNNILMEMRQQQDSGDIAEEDQVGASADLNLAQIEDSEEESEDDSDMSDSEIATSSAAAATAQQPQAVQPANFTFVDTASQWFALLVLI